MRPGLILTLFALSWFQLAKSSSSDGTCIHLRLVDRNIDALESAALRAAGLGEGAGEYLSHVEVAELCGRWE